MTDRYANTAGRVAALAVAGWMLAANAAADDLTLKRVMLSTGGVGYFEHEAVVTGNAELTLDLRLDQIDDVLKSIVVYDSTGQVGTIRLPGRDALNQLFRDLPFDASALTSPAALLQAMRGSEVIVEGGRQMRGLLIAVETENMVLPDGLGVVSRHRVGVITEAGLQSFLLEESDSVRFADDALQAEIESALAALAAHRARDRRTLVVESIGSGERVVRVGYVVGAPLWKASYRLTVGDGDDSGHIQGWAVLENMSGQDWSDVELTLLSGNPVTFRQALYTAYYVFRPEVPVEVLGRILPPADTGTVGGVVVASEEGRFREMERAAGAGFADDAEYSMPAPAMAMASEPMPAPPPAAPAYATQSEEAATQVVFRISEPVSVPSGQSLVVPIIDGRLPAERVALYQPATHNRHPLAAVRLVNDSATGLPPGPLTLYERLASGTVAYVGDARIGSLAVGDERLLSFALDTKTIVDVESHSERTIMQAALNRGTLRLTVRQRQTTTYRIAAPAGEARDILLEQPRQSGWDLVSHDPADIDLTDSHYRVPVSVDEGETVAIDVVLERPLVERVEVVALSYRQFEVYASSRELNDAQRAAFAEMARQRIAIDAIRRDISDLERDQREIEDDQERLRRNLGSVPRDSDLQRRYLDKLSSQEDAIEEIALALDDAREALEVSEAALSDYIESLDI